MKYYTNKEADALYEAGKVVFGCILKYKEIKDKNGEDYQIELWYSGITNLPEIVHENYLPEKKGYYLYVLMGSMVQCVDLETDNLVKACEAFNTVFETIAK